MMMSPSSSNGASSAITASTGAPALTMMMIRRGRSSEPTNSWSVWPVRRSAPAPCSAMNSSVRSYGAVVDGDREAIALDIEGEILAHHRQPNDSDVPRRLPSLIWWSFLMTSRKP